MGRNQRVAESWSGSGSAEAQFAAFYHREYQQQFRRARLMLRSTTLAEDVVHQAFVELWSRWSTVDEPGPYLNRSVLNGVRTHATTERRRLEILRSKATNAGPAAEREVLTDVLDRLPINQRAAVVLRYYGGLTDAEIAAALECPVGSIGPWIHRALKKLRRALS